MRTYLKRESSKIAYGKRFAEKQTTKKGSKIDLTQLDAEDLKKTLEEKLGTELTWDEYSWTATGEFAGCEITLNFVESDKGNKYQLSYAKEGSIHDRSVWEDDNMDDFERDTDAMIVELGDYAENGETPAEEEEDNGDLEDEGSLDNFEEPEEEEELDFGESAPRWIKGFRR